MTVPIWPLRCAHKKKNQQLNCVVLASRLSVAAPVGNELWLCILKGTQVFYFNGYSFLSSTAAVDVLCTAHLVRCIFQQIYDCLSAKFRAVRLYCSVSFISSFLIVPHRWLLGLHHLASRWHVGQCPPQTLCVYFFFCCCCFLSNPFVNSSGIVFIQPHNFLKWNRNGSFIYSTGVQSIHISIMHTMLWWWYIILLYLYAYVDVFNLVEFC